jgi:hypothetical protein
MTAPKGHPPGFGQLDLLNLLRVFLAHFSLKKAGETPSPCGIMLRSDMPEEEFE